LSHERLVSAETEVKRDLLQQQLIIFSGHVGDLSQKKIELNREIEVKIDYAQHRLDSKRFS
jgi:hypothetical protein